MNSFKQFLERVSGDQQLLIQDLHGIKNAITQASNYLLQVLSIYNFTEGMSLQVRDDAPHILSSRNFLNWMQQYKAEPISHGIRGYSYSCGQDGCAFFFTNNIVVKFSYDYKEANIANAIKRRLKIAPVIDVAEIEVTKDESIIYAIVMRKLDTDVYHISQEVKTAANIFADTCHNLMDLVESRQDVPIEYIRKRLSIGYMLKDVGQVSDGVKIALQDLVRLVRIIYKRSGYLVGADWSTRNIGLTKTGGVQAFDFGRAQQHAAVEPEFVPMTQIVV